MEWFTAALAAFVLIVPVELPDKTFVSTLILATRYRGLAVWLGVVAAFGVQCAIAVTAGSLLGLLPERPVKLVAAALFAVGAVVLARQASRPEEAPVRGDGAATERPGGWRAAGTSFVVLFTAEWGDLSQLLTAGLVASGRPALPVFVGAWAGLAMISGAAVLLGRVVLRHVRIAVVRWVAAGVCAVLAVLTVASVW
ncbi:MAG TPA: TMEM165/GDT1 family protein [Micromonosporaceae bacterium]|nr:TMEM165/GDT1 family protein [Micromonosporaceae bacterium]